MMSSEREAEIRATIEYSHSLHHKNIEYELLAEIERLREIYQDTLIVKRQLFGEKVNAEKERDALKARVINLRSVVQWCIGVLEGMGVRGSYAKDALLRDEVKDSL